MIHKKIILAVLVSVSISACTVPTRENFDTAINAYHGMSVDTLVETWGPPTASYVTADNNRVYQWTKGGGYTYFEGASYPWIGAQSHAYAPWNHALWPALGGGMYNSGVGMFISRPMTLDRSCTLNISANGQNVITGHQAIGSACVAD